MNNVIFTVFAAMAVLVANGAGAQDPADFEEQRRRFLEDKKLTQTNLAKYKDREIGVDKLFDDTLSGVSDELFGIKELLVYGPHNDEQFSVRLLMESNFICAMEPEKRRVFNKAHVTEEDYLVSYICSTAATLAEINKAAVAEVLNVANEQCGYIIEFCSDPEGISEPRLMAVAAKSNSLYMKSDALGRLLIRPSIADRARTIEVARGVLKTLDPRVSYPYEIRKVATMLLERAGGVAPGKPKDGGQSEDVRPGSPVQPNNVRIPAGRQGMDGGSKQQGAGRVDEHGKRTNDPVGPGTVWLAVGVGATVAVLALLAARTLRKK